MMNENENRISSLAREVLRLSRSTLLVNLRFLDAALGRLEPVETPGLSFAADGQRLAYDPRHVLRGYKTDRAIPVRDLLHVLLHCVYRHMFVHTAVERPVWDLACDVAAEDTIVSLGLRAAEAPREARQRAVLKELRAAVGQLTAEKLYRHFLEQRLSPDALQALREPFCADDHGVWYMTDEQKADAGLGSARGDGEAHAGGQDSGSGAPTPGSEDDWQNVSERLQMDLETFSRNQGRDPAAMLQNLREINRERYDYADFLRRFAVRGEVMQIDPDEFDSVYYTYGLHLYGNLPLIEPLEYRSVKRVKEFVVAIDTSGSVAGETVQRFVQKTWNVLKSGESFFTKINLHVIQCDAAVQEDKKLSSQAEFDAYLKSMQIRGLGGTDFRPVFAWVDRLIAQKEFENLKGLIYFTDGWGTFPSRMPAYETAFVFLDEENNNYDVPPWAIKLLLRKDEI